MKKLTSFIVISAVVLLVLGLVAPVRAEMSDDLCVFEIPTYDVNALTIIQITDTHGYIKKLINILEEVRERKEVDCIIHTGDGITCVKDPNKNIWKMQELDEVMQEYTGMPYIVKQCLYTPGAVEEYDGIPWFIIQGNHGFNEPFKKVFGPDAYMVYAGNYALIGFDGWTPRIDQLRLRMQKATQDGKLIILFDHESFYEEKGPHNISRDNSVAIKILCLEYPVIVFTHGDVHKASKKKCTLPGDSYLYSVYGVSVMWEFCGGAALNAEYSIITVKGTDVNIRFRKATPDKNVKEKTSNFLLR